LDAAETAVVVAAAAGDNRTDAHSTMGEDLLLPPGKGERVEILDEGTRLGEDNTTVLPEGESADSTPAVRTAQMFKELPQRLFAFASDDRIQSGNRVERCCGFNGREMAPHRKVSFNACISQRRNEMCKLVDHPLEDEREPDKLRGGFQNKIADPIWR
jgi:hypothetical protein